MKRFLMLFVLMSAIVLMVSAGSTYAVTQKSAESPQKTKELNHQQEMSSLSGKVVESMDSGGYTYVNIEKDGKKIWVAVTQMKVKVGQNISFQPGMVMRNFTSKTLNRTFESIVFSGGLAEQEKK